MSSLTCSEFDRLLIEQAAERNGGDERLHAHAASCRRCAEIWNEDRALDTAIEAWKADVPDADLSERVLARWRQERESMLAPAPRRERAPAQGRRHFALLAAAAAAGLILAVALFSQDSRRTGFDQVTGSHPRAGNAVANQPNPPAVGPGQDAGEIPVDQLVADMQTRYSSAASRMTRLVDGWKPQFPAIADVDVDLLPAGKAAPAPRPGPRNQSGGGLGETLKPIGRDVRKAFSFLRDAVPGLDGSST
jgi:hypothetical protein